MNHRFFWLLLAAGACAQSAQGVDPAPVPTTTTITTGSASSNAEGTSSRTRTVTTTTTVALNPVGTWSVTSEINGQPVRGTMTIRDGNPAYVGVISVEGQGDFPITSGKVDQQTFSFVFDTPNGAGTAKLTFSGGEFVGMWELAGQSGPLSGKRAP